MIRDADENDIQMVVEMGRRMAAESPNFCRLTYSPAKVEARARWCIADPDGFLMIAERGGVAIGMMAAFVSDHWMAEERISGDLVLYIEPEHRGGPDAARLVLAYKRWATHRGAVLRGLGISSGVLVEQTTDFYHRLGAKTVGVLLEI